MFKNKHSGSHARDRNPLTKLAPVQNDTHHLGASLPLAKFCRRVRLYDKGSGDIEGCQKAVNRAGDGFGRIVRAGHLIDVLADADVDNAAVQIP